MLLFDTLFRYENNTRIGSRCENCHLLSSPSYTDPKILACLVINLPSRIKAYNATHIVWRLSFALDWTPLEDDHLVKLFSLCFVHVHDYDAGLGLGIRGKVLLHERLPCDGKGVGVPVVVTPVL